MTKTIVITRAKGDEAELASALHDLGHRTIHEALTEIFLHHTARAELEHALVQEPDAIIVTSRHGARALATLSEMRDSAVLCVGETTSEVAESSGFTRVCAAGATVDELVNYISDAYDSDAHFVYVSAEHVRADLAQLLSAYVAHIHRIVAYEAVAAPALSEILTEQLKRGQLDAITFMSQRSAQIFYDLLVKAHAKDAAGSLHAFCLSQHVAEPLQMLTWQGVHIAKKPTLASLVECVDNALR